LDLDSATSACRHPTANQQISESASQQVNDTVFVDPVFADYLIR
jgi:uncharacterized protein YijF (DUF1287 family)